MHINSLLFHIKWLSFQLYAKLIQAVVLLFWCVCLSEGQLGQTPLPRTNEMGKLLS